MRSSGLRRPELLRPLMHAAAVHRLLPCVALLPYWHRLEVFCLFDSLVFDHSGFCGKAFCCRVLLLQSKLFALFSCIVSRLDISPAVVAIVENLAFASFVCSWRWIVPNSRKIRSLHSMVNMDGSSYSATQHNTALNF